MAEEKKGLGKLIAAIKGSGKREGGVKTASSNTEKAMMGGVEAFLGNIEGVLAQTVGSIVCGQDNLKTFAEVSNKIKAKNPLIEGMDKQTASLAEVEEISKFLIKNKENITTMFKDINVAPLMLKLATDTIEENKKYREDKDKDWKKFRAIFDKDSDFQKVMEKLTKLEIQDSVDAIKEELESVANEEPKKSETSKIAITGLDAGTTKGIKELVDSIANIKDENVKSLESLLAGLSMVASFTNNADLSKSYAILTALNKDFFDAKNGVIIQIINNLGSIPKNVSNLAKNGIEAVKGLGDVMDVLAKSGQIGIKGIIMAHLAFAMSSTMIFGKHGSAKRLIESLQDFGSVPSGVVQTVQDLNTMLLLIGQIGSPRNTLGVLLAGYVFTMAALLFNKKIGPARKFIESLESLPNVKKTALNSFNNLCEIIQKIGDMGDPKNSAKVYVASFVLTGLWLMFSSKGPARKLIEALSSLPSVSKSSLNSMSTLEQIIKTIGEMGDPKNAGKVALAAAIMAFAATKIFGEKGSAIKLTQGVKNFKINSSVLSSAENLVLLVQQIEEIGKGDGAKTAAKTAMVLYIFSKLFGKDRPANNLAEGLKGFKINSSALSSAENLATLVETLSRVGKTGVGDAAKSRIIISLYGKLFGEKGAANQLAEGTKEFKVNKPAITSAENLAELVENLSRIGETGVGNAVKSGIIVKKLTATIKKIANEMVPELQEFANAMKGMRMKDIQKKAQDISETLQIINSFPSKSVKEVKNTIKAIKEMTKGLDSIQELQEKLKSYKTALSEIQEVFEMADKVGMSAESATASTKKIDKGLNDVNKTAVDSGNKSKNAKKGSMDLKSVAIFVVTAAAVMLIGGMIMTQYPEMIAGSMKFGVTLMVFIGLVLAPITLMSVIAKGGIQSVKGFSALIITCTAVMLIGGMFMMMGGGKFVKNALTFGVVLGIFEALVVMPFLVFAVLKVCVANSIKAFTKFMLVCTIVMMVGAVFMMMGGGKMVKHALAFGLVLMMFETLVVLPFLVFAILRNNVDKAIVHFTAFVLVCTIVMLIGALFIDRKYAKKVLMFAKLLATFELAVVMPILLLKLLTKEAASVMRELSIFLVVSTAVMLIGAHFIKKGWAGPALAFTVLLSVFELAVIAPTLLLKKMVKDAMYVMLGLSAFIAVSAGVLMIGAVFITNYGAGPVMEFAAILAGFITIMGVIFGLLDKFKSQIGKGAIVATMLSIAVMALSVAMMLAHTAVKTAGGAQLLADCGILAGAMAIMAIVFGILGAPYIMEFVTLGAIAATAMGVALTALSIAFLILHVAMKVSNPMDDFQKLSGALIVAGIVFALLGLLSGPAIFGASAAVAMSVALTALSIAFLVLHVAMTVSTPFKDFMALSVALVAAGLVFAILGPMIGPILCGSISAAAMSVALLALSGAFALVHLVMSMKGIMGDIALMGLAVIGMGVVFAALLPIGLLAVPGAAVGLAIALAITALSGAFALVHAIAQMDILKDLGILIEAIGEVAVLCTAMLPLVVAVPLAMIPAALLLPLALTLGASLTAMGIGIAITKAIGKFDSSEIISSIENFFNITDACPGPLDYIKLLAKIGMLTELSFKMSRLAYLLGGTIEYLADLKVATKWNADGDPIKFKQLKESDFESAANGIKIILTTLASAITQTYNENPDLFGDDAEKILYRVKRLSLTEAYMIMTLSTALQSYAQLLIPTKWNNDGEPIKFRTMKESDFEAAANGIKTVLTTLAEAITDVYLNDQANGGLLFGDQGWDILRKVRRIAWSEGEMISSLSDGLIHYAQIMIPTKWNNKGVAVKFRQMKPEEFTQAAENIGKVMTVMAAAIRSAWTGEDFKSATGETLVKGDGRGLRSMWDVEDIIKSLAPMGELVSAMATGIQSYANLTIPDKWDKHGKPIHFMNIKDGDEYFGKAGENIGKVITCLATNIKEAWDKLNGGWFSTDVDEIIAAFEPMGDLISSMAQGIQDYANLQVPTHWSKGKADRYRTMNETDFTNAGSNIGAVLTLVAGAINMAWSGQDFSTIINGKTITYKGGGKGLSEAMDAEEFGEILDAFVSVGDLISGIAEGVQNYANLTIPIHWTDGKPDKFRTLVDTDFTNAGSNIVKILMATLFGGDVNGNVSQISSDTKVSGGLIGAYQALERLGIEDDLEDIMEVFSPVGDFISNMAESIHNYAELLIPTKWNENGKAVKFRTMKPSDFENAGIGISKILNCMVTAISGYADSHPDLFEDGEDSQFAQVVGALTGLGEMIKNIAEGVNAYASGTIPIEWDKEGKPINFKSIGEKEYTAAAVNIGLILGVLGQSVIEFAAKHPTWFQADEEGCPFKTVMDSVSTMGTMIKDISEGVQTYANGGIPEYNKDGKIIKYNPFPDDYFEKAGINIGKIISCVGQAVVDFYNGPDFKKFTAENGDFNEAMEAVTKIGTAVKNVADGVQAYANLNIPTHWDKNGKPDKFRQFKEEDFASCKINIGKLIVTLADAVIDAYNGTVEGANGTSLKTLLEPESPLDDILEATKSIGEIISTVTKTITDFAALKIPTGYDKSGKATGYHALKLEDIATMKSNIKEILTQLPAAITESQTPYTKDLITTIESVQDGITAIGSLMRDIVSAIKIFDSNSKQFGVLFKHAKSYKGTTPATLTIGYIIDVYGIVQEFSELSKLLTGENAFTLDTTITDKVQDAINDISAVISTVAEVTKEIGKYDKDITAFLKNNIIKNIETILGTDNGESGATGIVSLAKNIIKLGNILTDKNIETINKVVENFESVDSAISSIIGAIGNVQEDYADHKDAIQFVIDDTNKFAENMNKAISIIGDVGVGLTDEDFVKIGENTRNADDIIKGLIAFRKMIISLSKNVGLIENVLSLNYNKLHQFATNDTYTELVEDIVSKINDLQDIICGYNLIGTDTLEQALGNTKHAYKVIKGLEAFQKMINEMISYVIGIKISLDTNKAVLNQFIRNEEYEQLVESVVEKIGKINDILAEVDDYEEVLENVINIQLSVERLIKLADKSYKVNPKAFDALILGIKKLSVTLQHIKYSETFQKNVTQLDKFVRTVNSISLTKLNPLIELTKQMNALAKRMGNLDKLTDAIANALSGVLQELVKQIKHAEKTIKDADVLQKRRHQLINDSMTKIKGIMENPLVVEVKAAAADPNADPNATTNGTTTDPGTKAQDGKAVTPPAGNAAPKDGAGPSVPDNSANTPTPNVGPGPQSKESVKNDKNAKKSGTDYLLQQILNTLRSQGTAGRNRK